VKTLKIFVVIMIVVALLIVPSTAFASYAYDYARDDFNWGLFCLDQADECWSMLGLTYTSYYGPGFQSGSFKLNCSSGNGVYADTHGSPDSIADDAGYSITRWDVSSYRNGDWKRLIFLDACDTADNSNWASAWGISNGDGSLHTYLGWVGYSYDNYHYAFFTDWFYQKVQDHYSIKYSIERASAETGVTNYRYYGNPNWYF